MKLNFCYKYYQQKTNQRILRNLFLLHKLVFLFQQFHLKKVMKYWGYKDEKFYYFMLAPEWIKFDLSSNRQSPSKKHVSASNVTRMRGQSHMDITKTSNTIDESESFENSGLGLFQYQSDNKTKLFRIE